MGVQHCIVVFSTDDFVCCSMETDISFNHDVFDSSGLHQMPNGSKEILSNMEAIHAQDKFGILLFVLLLQTKFDVIMAYSFLDTSIITEQTVHIVI